jgi:hypothetical protein
MKGRISRLFYAVIGVEFMLQMLDEDMSIIFRKKDYSFPCNSDESI